MDVQERWYLSGSVVDEPPGPGAAQPGETLMHWTAITCSLEADRDDLQAALRRARVLAPALHRTQAGPVQGGRRPSLRRHGEVLALSLRALTYVDARDAVETRRSGCSYGGPRSSPSPWARRLRAPPGRRGNEVG